MTEPAKRSAIYLDTNVFIYAVEGQDGPARSNAQALLRMLQRQDGSGVTSELTIAELLAPRGSGRSAPPAALEKAYLDLLTAGEVVRLAPVSRHVLVATAALRSRSASKLTLPDAIHLATALDEGCAIFVSEDGGYPDLAPMRRVSVSAADLLDAAGAA